MVHYMVYEPVAQSYGILHGILYMYTSLVRLAWKQITTDLYSVCYIIHFLAPKVYQKLYQPKVEIPMVNLLKEIKQEGGVPKGLSLLLVQKVDNFGKLW